MSVGVEQWDSHSDEDTFMGAREPSGKDSEHPWGKNKKQKNPKNLEKRHWRRWKEKTSFTFTCVTPLSQTAQCQERPFQPEISSIGESKYIVNAGFHWSRRPPFLL